MQSRSYVALKLHSHRSADSPVPPKNETFADERVVTTRA